MTLREVSKKKGTFGSILSPLDLRKRRTEQKNGSRLDSSGILLSNRGLPLGKKEGERVEQRGGGNHPRPVG